MKTVQLKKYQVADLVAFLNSLKPADLGDLRVIRKISSVTDTLEKGIKDYNDLFEGVRKDVQKFIDSEQVKVKALEDKAKAEADTTKKHEIENEKAELQNGIQAGIRPFNEKLKTLKEKDGEVKVAVDIDPNHFAELSEQFKRHAASKYVITKEYVMTADALGIED